MSPIILYFLILILLALGLFQLYKSIKTKESMNTKQQHHNKIGNDKSQKDESVVYNINEREIVINEVVDKKAGEPKPLTSLNCNCWPLGSSATNHPSINNKKRKHHHKMKPHEEEQDSSHHIPTHKGYAKQIHSRDSKTGLIADKGPEGAAPYELISGFR